MINRYRLTTPTSQFKSDYSQETPLAAEQTISKTFPTAIKPTSRLGLQNPYNGGLRSHTIQPFPTYRNIGNMEQFPTVVPGDPPQWSRPGGKSWTEQPGNMEQFPKVVPGTPSQHRIQPIPDLRTQPGNMEQFPVVIPGSPPQRPVGGSWTENPIKTPGSARPWGVALPGQSYIQVEGPGNPSWEARNPQLNPANTVMNQIKSRI